MADTNFLDEAIKKGLEKSKPVLQEMFAKSAGFHSWPSDVVNEIKIIPTGSEIQMEFSEDMKSRIHDLEYGMNGQPPAAATRNFTARIGTELESVVALELLTAVILKAI